MKLSSSRYEKLREKRWQWVSGKPNGIKQASYAKSFWILFAQIALLFILVSSVASSDGKKSEGERNERSPRLPTIEVDEAITSLIDYLQVAKSSTTCESEMDSLRERWQKIATTIASDTTLKNSGIGKIIVKQIGSISSILDYQSDGSNFGLEETKQELNTALETLYGLMRMADAARDSVHTALLVVSSVACECETERCIRMLALYDSLFHSGEKALLQEDVRDALKQDSTKDIRDPKQVNLQEWRSTVAQVARRLNSKSRISENHLAAILDFFQTQAIEDVVGTFEIPSWLLFDRNGNLAMLIGGSSNPDDAAETLTSWLGKTLRTGLKKDKSTQENNTGEGVAPETQATEGGNEDGKRHE